MAPPRSYFSIIPEAEPSANGEEVEKASLTDDQLDSYTSDLLIRIWEGVLIDYSMRLG